LAQALMFRTVVETVRDPGRGASKHADFWLRQSAAAIKRLSRLENMRMGENVPATRTDSHHVSGWPEWAFPELRGLVATLQSDARSNGPTADDESESDSRAQEEALSRAYQFLNLQLRAHVSVQISQGADGAVQCLRADNVLGCLYLMLHLDLTRRSRLWECSCRGCTEVFTLSAQQAAIVDKGGRAYCQPSHRNIEGQTRLRDARRARNAVQKNQNDLSTRGTAKTRKETESKADDSAAIE